jgi:hypothetical protein
MRCEDPRDESALLSFHAQAEVNPKGSGLFGPYHDGNLDHFFNHFCQKQWHIVLLGNHALMAEYNVQIEEHVLALRSDRKKTLKNKGIKPASLKVMVHNSGTLFAGLAAVQVSIANYFEKMKDKTLSQHQVTNVVEHLCKHSVNLSVIDVSEISKSGRKLLKLGLLQNKGLLVVKFKHDTIDVIEKFDHRKDAIQFCMNYVIQSPFLTPTLHISQHRNTEKNRQWQDFNLALIQQKNETQYTLPSLAAMLTFGKSIINFGWIELEK